MGKNYSAGVILIHRTSTDIQIIMIKRRFSYAFGDFINGRYSTLDTFAQIAHMFRYMTAEEKAIISSNSAPNIFYHYWLVNPTDSLCPVDIATKYKSFCDRFSSLIRHDMGRQINELLIRTPCISCLDLFEFPKGKVKPNEDSLDAAKRELKEETNYNENNYILYDDIKPLNYILNAPDNGEVYITDYYIGEVTIANAHTSLKMTDWSQKIEVSEIRRFSISSIRDLFPHYRALCDYITAVLKTKPHPTQCVNIKF